MRIIDQLTKDILQDSYFKKLYLKSSLNSAQMIFNSNNQKTNLSEKEFVDILRFSDILSNSGSSEGRNKSHNIISYLNAEYKTNEVYRTFSKAVYSKLGNFPALQYLENKDNNKAEVPILRAIQEEAKKLIQEVPESDSLVFTDSQYELYQELTNSIQFSFSGPTSMGKSFIIKAFIKKVIMNIPPENLVVIVPTRALINQFATELKQELKTILENYDYRILTNSSIADFEESVKHNYILVLTPERLISYLSQPNAPSIGFVFVDEAHKLANEKDSRSITTYTAIEKAINKFGNLKLYFSSPNVSNPEIFLKLFDRVIEDSLFQTDESPVSQNLFFIDLLSISVELIVDESPVNLFVSKEFWKNNTTSAIIDYVGNDKNNLIYCNSKNRTIEEANNYAKTQSPSYNSEKIINAIKQIKDYIHPEYYLSDLLKYGIAYHYGKLPQLIRNLVEGLYKEEIIKNVFCTSTLLEGVNMPTQNIFILSDKNGSKPLQPIDFWNLAGRAGRLTKELSGNIFCIKSEKCLWKNKEALLTEKIELKPTVISKIDRNIRKIEKILKEEDVSGTEEEKDILKYISNIIAVDTLEVNSNYKSPIIEKLISNNKEKIIELAKTTVENFEIPYSILRFNQSINLKTQNKVFELLSKSIKKGERVLLPKSSEINYKNCLIVLNNMYILYNWENAEKRLQNKNSLKYYAVLMNQWMNGLSLKQIIQESIVYHANNNLKIQVNYNEYVSFEKNNKKHINILIEKIIDDIEYILRFLFEKYFNHYHQILIKLLSEENAGENWASLLEYGTKNRIIIALQNLGLSRYTATKIYEKANQGLIIENGKLKTVKKTLLLKAFSKDSLEFAEIQKVI